MDLLIESLDLFLDIVGGDLEILNGSADHELENTIGDGLLLITGLPEETVLLNGQNFGSESVEICLLTPRLHLPNNEGLGDDDFTV